MNFRLCDLPEHLQGVAAMYAQCLIPVAHKQRSTSVAALHNVLDQVITSLAPERVLQPVRLQVRPCPYSVTEHILLCIFSYQGNVLATVATTLSKQAVTLRSLLSKMEGPEGPQGPQGPQGPFREVLLSVLSCLETALGSDFVGQRLITSEFGVLRIDKEAIVMQMISSTRLDSDQDIYLQEMLKVSTTKGGSEELIQSPLVIFYADRQATSQARVRCTDTLTTPNGDRFFLAGVLTCDKGVYTTFVRHDRLYVSTEGHRGPLPSTTASTGLLYVYQPLYESVDDYHLRHWTSDDTLCIYPFTDTLTDSLRLYRCMFSSVSVARCYPAIRRYMSTTPADEADSARPLSLHVLSLTDYLNVTRDLISGGSALPKGSHT